MTRQSAFLGSFLLVACGLDSSPRELTDLGVEPPGDHCAAGGVAVQTGQDEDGDGALSDDEVDATTFICNLPDGAGASLVTIEEEPPGDDCEDGGLAIHSGTDADGDGELSSEEVEETDYVCDVVAPHDVILGNVLINSAEDAGVLTGTRVVTGRLTVDALGLDELDLSSLEEVMGDVEILTASVAAIDAPLLAVVGNNLTISTAEAVTISLPSLERVGRTFEIEEEELTALDLSTLQKVGSPANEGSLLIYGKVANLSFPALTYVKAFLTLAGDMDTISVPSLERVWSFGAFESPTLTSLEFPLLEEADFLGINHNEVLALAAGFPSLQRVGELTILGNDGLTDLDFPALTDVTLLRVQDNPLLPTCDAVALSDQVTPNSILISGNDDAGTCP